MREKSIPAKTVSNPRKIVKYCKWQIKYILKKKCIFNQKKILLEVHLFNFSGNLYNKYLTVKFLRFIRKEKKFKNIDQLKKMNLLTI